MHVDLADRARAGIEAFSRGDLDAALDGFSDDVVWEVAAELVPDAGVYRGHEGVRRFWSDWHDLFEGFRLEVVQCEVLDESRMLAVTRAHGVGAGSGITIASPQFVQLFEFRGGEVVRVRLAASRDGALAAG